VALHSVSESLDLSSASGRMFYNILGSFAQFYREQIAENVKMGSDRAVKEGKWINRPKTGYDLVDGELVPNGDAARIVEVFRLRAKRMSYRTISERTGINYSTVMTILKSRIYFGEVLHNGEWFPGRHQAIITQEEWHAAQRSVAMGVQPASDFLSGRVRCGLCERRMAVAQNGKGSKFYLCRHRGQGCGQPARSTRGLARAAVLGMSIVGHDERLQAAIRRRLAGGSRAVPGGGHRGRRAAPAKTLATLSSDREKLLALYYSGNISAEGFKEAEDRICAAIEAARQQVITKNAEERSLNELETRFEDVARVLSDLDVEVVWEAAEESERRVLVEELIESVTIYPDHLEVTVAGAPR